MKMFSPLKPLELQYRILLGSKSPRRKDLMKMLDIPFEVIKIEGIEEVYSPEMPKHLVPEYLSQVKFNGFKSTLRKNDLLITADTVVISDGIILGKPHDRSHACDMLKQLSGKTHEVVTGVNIGSMEKSVSFSSVSSVTFGNLSSEEIQYYVDKYEPLDKAGAYGIQEWIGCVAVKEIKGSFYNIMGLPVYQLYHVLKEF